MDAKALRPLSCAVSLALLLVVTAVGTATAETPTRSKRAEKYALSLLNCTRTGGWVKADGTCKGRGSGTYSAYRRPLQRHWTISHKVAFPWARTLVVYEVCGHSIADKPDLGTRLSSKGFRYHTYGENVGCGWGGATPKQVVLASHRAMQAEKKYGGGHWRNMKDRRYQSVGIGVAKRDGSVRVVYDFYGKRAW